MLATWILVIQSVAATDAAEPNALPPTVAERMTRVAVWILPGAESEAVDAARAVIGRLPTRHEHFELQWIGGDADAASVPLEQVNRARHDVLMIIGLGSADSRSPTDEARTAMELALRQGLGLVLVNGATAAFPDWPAYTQAVGGPCIQAAEEGLTGVRLVDAPHPAAEWLDNGWLVSAPVWMPKAGGTFDGHIVLGVDNAATDWSGMKVPAEAVVPALAWSRMQGAARIFATGIGGPDVWADEGWERMLRGAVRWTAGQAAGAPPEIQQTPVRSAAGILWESAPPPMVATSRPVAGGPVVADAKWQPLPGGGWYLELSPGNGSIPTNYERLFIHTRAWLADGTVVRDSFRAGEPIEFTFGMRAVDAGLEEAVKTLLPRGRRRVFLPPGRNDARNYTNQPVAPNAGFWVEVYRY